MSSTVTWLFEGSLPCSWKALFGKGSISLKEWIPVPSHRSDHQSCNSPCVDPLSSPSCSSWDVVFALSCWIVNLIDMIHVLKTYRIDMNVTYYDLGINNWKSFYIGMICDVISEVCHDKVCGCVLCGLSEIVVMAASISVL